MTLYCETWAEYVKARHEVEKYGFVMISPKTGSPFVNTLRNVEAMLKKQLLQYLSELGLSPTSRTRLHAEQREEEETGRGRFFKTVG